jgi:hypothetical protein
MIRGGRRRSSTPAAVREKNNVMGNYVNIDGDAYCIIYTASLACIVHHLELYRKDMRHTCARAGAVLYVLGVAESVGVAWEC